MSKTAQSKRRRPTAQQIRFARHYVISLNATDAAKKAGYKEKNAAQLGYQQLQNPSVQSEIRKLARARERRLDLKADSVLRNALEIAESDIADVFESDGTMRAVHDMPEQARRAVSSVKVREIFGQNREVVGQTTEIKLWDKIAANRLLAQHLGLLREIHEHHVKSDIVGALREGRRRAGKAKAKK